MQLVPPERTRCIFGTGRLPSVLPFFEERTGASAAPWAYARAAMGYGGRRRTRIRGSLRVVALVALLVAALVAPNRATAAAPYDVGAARVDVTPPPLSAAAATPAAFAK